MKQPVPVLGINRAETDLTVKDGSCETLHNLRYDAGAWRNVEAFRRIGAVTDFHGFELLYKHPMTADDLYIAIDTTGAVHEVRYADGAFSSTQTIMPAVSGLSTVFSFGHVLVIVTDNKELYFVLYGGEYVRFEMPDPPDISESKADKVRFGVDFYYRRYWENHDIKEEFADGDNLARHPNIAPDGGYYYTRITDRVNQTLHLPMYNGEYWQGAIALMVAYRMMDGTVVANSELMIFASDAGDDGWQEDYGDVVADGMPNYVPEKYRTGIFFGCKAKISPGSNTFYIEPQVTIKIPAGIDTRIVQSVVICSTRIVPIYDFEKTWKDNWSLSDRGGGGYYQTYDFRKLFTEDVDLMQEPLYRIKEIEIRDFVDNRHSESLSYNDMKNVESMPVYEPTQSHHTQVGKCYYEYNGRLHKANLRTQLFPGYSRFCLGNDGEDAANFVTKMICTVDIDNTRKQVCQSIRNFKPTRIRRVVSYPDYRAIKFAVCTNDPGSMAQLWWLDVTLESCKGNNYAYAIPSPTSRSKYPSFWMPETPIEHEIFEKEDDVYTEPNRVQVSALNNLFSQPFANSYRVGLNEETIFAIATVVDELSATRFGAFPLYVFTDRGVWSLESGTGEVLYSNILPVNHDQIVNPNTCAALETVYYITSRGVHALRGRSSEVISRELEQYPGELAEYLTEARIYFQFKYGDLIVFNRAYSYAYVYSIAAGVWATRDMAGRVLNNDEVVTAHALATLTDEQMIEPVECWAVTRPLKLGTTEFKRLETVVARIMSQDCFAHIIVEGSNDCNTWSVLRDAWCNVQGMDARLRRTPLSYKFFRLRLHLTANCRISTTSVDVEFYPRFVGRLR